MARTTALITAGMFAAGLMVFTGAVSAAPATHAAALKAVAQEIAPLPDVETVRWRGRGYGGWGYGGFAAGALLGGGLGYRYYYAPPPYYAPYYEPYAQPYYGPPAGPPPAYYAEDSGDVGYCARRFKSYDPRSGTYVGLDGRRRPCP